MRPFQKCIAVTAVHLFYEVSSRLLDCTFLQKKHVTAEYWVNLNSCSFFLESHCELADYYYDLYSSTSCCINQEPSQWERESFDITQLRDPSTDFHETWFFETYNYFQDMTPHAKFQEAKLTWVVWENSQFDAWKFLTFFTFLNHPTGRIFGHIPTHNTSLYVVPAKEVAFGD